MKRLIVAAVAACVLLLAGCGGSSTVHLTRSGPVKVVLGHPCNPRDQVMQCVLPPAPVGIAPISAPAVAYGIDFAWGCQSPSGRSFGASYLSDSSKDWTVACLHVWHADGKATVFVRETAGNRALDGCSAGASDARAASAELARDGAPSSQPFDMAIDFDAAGPDVASYFQCASQAEPGRVNAYGGALPILYLADRHLVGHLNWVTYAWLYRNGNVWPPASIAPLEQYQLGSSVDLDRALAANYGQWPYTPPKPPGPSKQQIAKWIAQRNAALKAYNHAGCKYPVLVGPNECHTSAATVVSVQATLDRATHASVGCWGPHAQLTAPVCTIVRPQVSVWSHARTSSYNALQKAGCHGPAAPIVKGTPLCRKLNQRAEYFNAKAKALFKAWA